MKGFAFMVLFGSVALAVCLARSLGESVGHWIRERMTSKVIVSRNGSGDV